MKRQSIAKVAPESATVTASDATSRKSSVVTWTLDGNKGNESTVKPENPKENKHGIHFVPIRPQYVEDSENHISHTPGATILHKNYDVYNRLMDKLDRTDKIQRMRILAKWWRNKCARLIKQIYPWPPKLLGGVFWTHGYYNDLIGAERKVNPTSFSDNLFTKEKTFSFEKEFDDDACLWGEIGYRAKDVELASEDEGDESKKITYIKWEDDDQEEWVKHYLRYGEGDDSDGGDKFFKGGYRLGKRRKSTISKLQDRKISDKQNQQRRKSSFFIDEKGRMGVGAVEQPTPTTSRHEQKKKGKEDKAVDKSWFSFLNSGLEEKEKPKKSITADMDSRKSVDQNWFSFLTAGLRKSQPKVVTVANDKDNDDKKGKKKDGKSQGKSAEKDKTALKQYVSESTKTAPKHPVVDEKAHTSSAKTPVVIQKAHTSGDKSHAVVQNTSAKTPVVQNNKHNTEQSIASEVTSKSTAIPTEVTSKSTATEVTTKHSDETNNSTNVSRRKSKGTEGDPRFNWRPSLKISDDDLRDIGIISHRYSDAKKLQSKSLGKLTTDQEKEASKGRRKTVVATNPNIIRRNTVYDPSAAPQFSSNDDDEALKLFDDNNYSRYSLHVSNLPDRTTIKELLGIFPKGKIAITTAHGRTAAFVHYDKPEDTKKAYLDSKNVLFHGKPIYVAPRLKSQKR